MEAKTINPIDQDLEKLEQEIRRLKVEYDIYFNGATARPPYDTKGRVETMIKRLYEARGMSFGQRFRYNGLVARYNVMRELWRRQTQEREESGRPPTAEAQAAARSYTLTVSCRDPRREPEKVSELYDYLVAAKRECGERLGNLTLEVFTKFLNSRADQIQRNLGGGPIEFVIGVEQGQVKFTARTTKKSGEWGVGSGE